MTKLDLLVNLLLQEGCLIWSLWSVLGIVPSEWPFPIIGVGKKRPKALVQSPTHRLDKGLIGMTGEKELEVVEINRSSDSKQIRMVMNGL